MNTVPTWPAWLGEDALLLTLGVLTIKLTLLLAAAWCAHGMLLQTNPRWRVLLWRSTGIGIVLVFALTVSPPFASWSVLPAAIGEQDAATHQAQGQTERAGKLRALAAQSIAGDREALEAWGRGRWPLTDDAEASFDRAALQLSGDARPVEPATAVTADATINARGEAEPLTARGALTAYPRLLRWIAGIWLAGVLSLCGRMLCGLRRLRGIVHGARPVPSWVEDEAAAVADQLECPREFQVRQSGDVATPCLVGIRRPVVLLPEPQCDIARREELPAIFAHEAAHLMGRDLPWNAALHVLSLLLWWHPLTCRIRAAHAAACDAVADAIAANHVGDVTAYGRTLARLAVRLHTPAPAAALAMARTSDIRRRIEALQRTLFPNPIPRRRKVTVLAVGTIALTLLGGVTLTPAQSDPQPGLATQSVPRVESSSTSNEKRTNPTLLAAQNDPPKDEFRNEGATEPGPPKAGVDLYGDPLPPGAVSRLGTVRYRHPGSDKHIEFVPGGTAFAVGAFQSTVRLWDALSGKMVREIDIGDDYLHAFRVSADGKSIVTLSRTSDFDETERILHMRLVVWDAKSGEEIRPIEWDEPFRSRAMQLALSPDGKTAAVATREGEVRVWDLPWGEERLRKKLAPDEVDCLEFSPDGKLIAAASTRAVVLWEYGSDKEPQKLEGLRRGGQVVRFSPDGKILAVGSSHDKAAHLFDVKSRKLIRELNGQCDHYYHQGLCFAKNGQQLMVPAVRMKTVEVFDVDSGRLLRSLDTGDIEPTGVSLSSDGRLLASVDWGASIAVHDLTSGERISDRFVGHADAPWDVAFTPDDRHVVTASSDATIRIWEAETGRQVRMLSHDRWVAGFAVSPDGKWLASCGLDDTVRLWDFATGEERYKLPGHGTTGGSHSTAVAFSTDGERFYSFGMDFNLRAHTVETGRILAEHAIRPSGLQVEETDDGRIRFGGGGEIGAMRMSRLTASSQAACSADAATFFLSTQGGIHVFETDSGMETEVLKPADHYRKFCVTPRGDLVATVEQLANPNADPHDRASRRYVLRIRDVATGNIVNEAKLDGGFGYQMAFSPDGKLIAASQAALNWTPAANRWIDVWKVDTLERVARVAEKTPAVRGIGISHDGRRLATSHEDSTVTVWDLEAFSAAR